MPVATGVQVYFGDPRNPWQRATRENSNGLLRPYVPKGTELPGDTQAQLNVVAFGFVRDHQAMFPVAPMCRVLGVSWSGFCAWMTRPRTALAVREAAIVGEHRRRGVRTTDRGVDEVPATDLVQRDFTASASTIEGWYTPHRRHSALGQQSPMRYELVTPTAA